MTGRSKREDAARAVRSAGYSHEMAEQIIQAALDEHANELADKQQGRAKEEWAGNDARMILRRRVARHLAELIRPDKPEGGDYS